MFISIITVENERRRDMQVDPSIFHIHHSSPADGHSFMPLQSQPYLFQPSSREPSLTPFQLSPPSHQPPLTQHSKTTERLVSTQVNSPFLASVATMSHTHQYHSTSIHDPSLSAGGHSLLSQSPSHLSNPPSQLSTHSFQPEYLLSSSQPHVQSEGGISYPTPLLQSHYLHPNQPPTPLGVQTAHSQNLDNQVLPLLHQYFSHPLPPQVPTFQVNPSTTSHHHHQLCIPT